MSKDLSIIIPLYNKSKYIKDCMDALIQLELENHRYEVIVVDDCSSDQSYDIVKHYSDAYSHIHLYQLPHNSGSPAEPRNIGMAYAEGTYITLLDADDWLDPQGFPELLNQVMKENADIGFGQIVRHDDNKKSKVARFSSFTKMDHIVPSKIERIFRSVGPPAKIFKKSIVEEHQLQFEELKYGEDKLFFTKLIALCKSASMTDEIVYHVNRYSENQSLVSETDVFEKAELNLLVLEKVIAEQMPYDVQLDFISRVLELDFLSRFIMRKGYLYSEEQSRYHHVIERFFEIIAPFDYDLKDLCLSDRYYIAAKLLQAREYDKLYVYIDYLLNHQSIQYYIEKDRIFIKLPKVLKSYGPLCEEIYTVYNGTRKYKDKLFEVIEVFNHQEIVINKIILRSINDALDEVEVSFIHEGQFLYIPLEEMTKKLDTYNIVVTYGQYHETLVHATYPSCIQSKDLKRRNYKLEFGNSSKDIALNKKYYTEVSDYIFIKKLCYLYEDAAFKNKIEAQPAGMMLKVKNIGYSGKGIPRFVTNDGWYITANRKFVTSLKADEIQSVHDKLDDYITDIPEKVKIIKICKLYDDLGFKDENPQMLKKGTVITVSGIEYTKNFTPRLVTNDGKYLTANMKFVQIV